MEVVQLAIGGGVVVGVWSEFILLVGGRVLGLFFRVVLLGIGGVGVFRIGVGIGVCGRRKFEFDEHGFEGFEDRPGVDELSHLGPIWIWTECDGQGSWAGIGMGDLLLCSRFN